MTTNHPSTIRLAHFSDIHIAVPVRWAWRDWLGKRFSGWINLKLLGRGRRFADSSRVLEALVRDLDERRPDHVIFSGDATSLGFPQEFEAAAEILRPSTSQLPGIAVPGNHDYYTPVATASGTFERCFASWQSGDRVDGAPYPFAQQVGPVALIGVNSSVDCWLPWDASGLVGSDQLERLARLLDSLPQGPRILVTHYPVAKANGQPNHPSHGLRDLAEMVRVCDQGGVSLWLHGHRHDPFHLNSPTHAPFPVICAGSATERGHCGYFEYLIQGAQLQALRRTYDPATGRFDEARSFELSLRC